MKNYGQRRLLLSTTLNTRDLGGYPCKGGRMTQFGRVFRTDAPPVLTEADLRLLAEYTVTTAIDLRSGPETEHRPSGFAEQDGIDYHIYSFSDGNENPEVPSDVPQIYAKLFSDHANIRRIFTTIANAPGGVIYHCAVGKDRTGIVSALLLLICGVGESDVLADYQVSYTYLRPLIAEMHRQHPEFPIFLGHSDMEYMETALRNLFDQYGDAENYLLAAGVSSETITKLRAKLLDE